MFWSAGWGEWAGILLVLRPIGGLRTLLIRPRRNWSNVIPVERMEQHACDGTCQSGARRPCSPTYRSRKPGPGEAVMKVIAGGVGLTLLNMRTGR